MKSHEIAIIIPCYNEGKSIGEVVRSFKQQLPSSKIYVFDNNSTDNTVEEAKNAGAIVRFERKQGKGNVVRTMFRDIEADIYVMVDGDGTYPPEKVHDLIMPIINGNADMVIGSRLHKKSRSEFRRLNLFGNWFFRMVINTIFKVSLTDILSGYRAFSRKFVKSIPILSSGFEIETELTIRCLESNLKIVEVPIDLRPRQEGSISKINVVKDGLIILNTIFSFFRDFKPLTAFGFLGIFLILIGFLPGGIVIYEYLKTGYILRIPSAILSVGLVLSGLIVIFVGLILHTISRRFQAIEYQMVSILHYLSENKRENAK